MFRASARLTRSMFDFPLHRFIVHFPIVLAVFAFIYDGWAVYAKRPEAHDTGYGLSLWAGLLALTAVVTGLQIASLSELGKGAITGHALYGMTAAIVLTAFGLMRYSVRARRTGENENYTMVWLLVQALATLLILVTATTGHNL